MQEVNAATFNYLSASIPMGVNLHSMLGPEGNQQPWQRRAVAMVWLLPLDFNGKINSLLESYTISKYLSGDSSSTGDITED